jgi:cellulose biosynthesis protein BcsQ
MMTIITVQSMSGGTGVSLTAAQLAMQACRDGMSVVAIDTCYQRRLAQDLAPVGFTVIGHIDALFQESGDGLALNFTKAALIARFRDEDVPLQFSEKLPWQRENAKPNFLQNIARLQRQFDVVVVDVVNKDQDCMAMFSAVSDEVHLMHRTIPYVGSINDWRERVGLDPSVTLHVREDRGEVFSAGRMINASLGHAHAYGLMA